MLFRKKRKRQIELREVLRKNGNVFFEYVNNLELPAKRAIAAEVAVREATMNMTSEVLVELIDKMIELAEKGKIVDLFAILKEMKTRIQYISEEETLRKLATVYFVMNNEDESSYIREEQQKKIDVWKADQDLGDFFLQKAYDLTMSYSATSKVDIITYLKKYEADIKKIEKYLQNSISTNI